MVTRTDILVAGAGAAGLTTAIALAGAGFSVAVRGDLDTRRNGRTVALFEASLRLYRALNIWDRLAPLAMPIEMIRIIDDTGSFLPTPTLELNAEEIDLDAFGANIENAALVTALAAIAQVTPGVSLKAGMVGDYAFGADHARAITADGEEIEAQLIVGADGRNSPLREAAAITFRKWDYPQVALTALLSHSRPHWRSSTEFHTRQGPCTLVPLPAEGGSRHRSSLVWLMSAVEAERRMALSEPDLAGEIEHQVHRLHGAITLEGPRGAFPIAGLKCDKMVAPRVALVADAAHFFPPIGAQGLNLGLRDVAQLVESLDVYGRDDAGCDQALKTYDRRRRLDVGTRSLGVDILNRSLLWDTPPVDLARGMGIIAMAAIGPLRRALLREGVTPPGRLPALMRAVRER